MSTVYSARLSQVGPLAEGVFDAAVATARATARVARRAARGRGRRGRYASLRVGAETPMWNEVAGLTLSYLTRRGQKARLARVLGISRQRLHKLLVERSAFPDAERALQLMAWLAARQRGIEPS